MSAGSSGDALPSFRLGGEHRLSMHCNGTHRQEGKSAKLCCSKVNHLSPYLLWGREAQGATRLCAGLPPSRRNRRERIAVRERMRAPGRAPQG